MSGVAAMPGRDPGADRGVGSVRSVEVTAGDGTPLHVLEAGDPGAPAVLLLHGIAQSAWSWVRQLHDPGPLRIVAMDLRGHGASQPPPGAPGAPEPYSGQVWADDVAAVIEDRQLHRPVLCGWSFGGVVAMDYLAVHSDAALSGVCTVGAPLMAGVPGAERLFGAEFVALLPALMTSEDAAEVLATRRALLDLCTAQPLDAEDLLLQLGASLLTPTWSCGAALARPVDRCDAAAAVSVPWWAVHGTLDRVIDPAAADHLAEVQPRATVDRWEGVGHSPFLERPERFTGDLRSFVATVTA
ncbi:MAG: alpha/beta fold hydrolase [Dermatophilaceae bacterium]